VRRGKRLAGVLGVVLAVATAHAAAAARIGNCAGGRFAPNLSTVVGLPFEDPSSPGGTIVIGDGAIVLGACATAAAPFTVARHRRLLRARWQGCGPFTRVRLRLELGASGQCDGIVGIIRYRDATGRRGALKFPADRVPDS